MLAKTETGLVEIAATTGAGIAEILPGLINSSLEKHEYKLPIDTTAH